MPAGDAEPTRYEATFDEGLGLLGIEPAAQGVA
jgi:hypothetical protein